MRRYDEALEKIRERLEKGNYICGSITKISELLGIPKSTLRKILSSGKFKVYKLKSGKSTYYMIFNHKKKK